MYSFEPHLTDIIRTMINREYSYYLADITDTKHMYKRRYSNWTSDIGIYSLKNNHFMSIL